jgi:ABC-type lipoprotein release transport system permease subunit
MYLNTFSDHPATTKNYFRRKKNMWKKLFRKKADESANVQLILMAVVAAIVIAVSIIIVYAVLGGIDYTAIDAKLPGTPCANASSSLQTNLATFYSVAPIYIVVLAAVGIISAIMMIVITRKK